MPLLVGLNGFGRIGRIILRTCFIRSNIEIIAINDPVVDTEYICYLIKFDSTHGKLNNEISHSGTEIVINGKKIKVFHEKLPSAIPWHTLNVEYVVEASGMFLNMDKASGHLMSSSVKCVLVTAPSVDIPMLILGVNDDDQLLKKGQRVISCASSTLYCLAPIVKILEDNYGVSEGFVTSVHAMTPSLKPLDGLCLKGRHWRDHRSIHQNIIPAPTSACKALGKIIPAAMDKFCGLAFRVPIVNVSVLDITVRLNKSTSIQEIAAIIEKESAGKIKNIITTSYDEAVSSDFMNNEHSCILDVNTSLQLTPTSFKLVCWYENEYSYASRVIDTIFLLHERFKGEESKPLVSAKLRSESACETNKNKDDIKQRESNKLFNTISLKDHLSRNIPNVRSILNADKHLTQKVETNLDDEKDSIILICDDKSNTKIVQGIDIQCSNIIDNRRRLELANKELARITSKTEDLLKDTNHDKSNTHNLNNQFLEPSTSNDKTKYADDDDEKNASYNKDQKHSTIKENHIDPFPKIKSELEIHKDAEAVPDVAKELDATYESAIEDTIFGKPNIDVEYKNQNISLHNLEASIIISDRDGKENTIVTITSKHKVANDKVLYRNSRSHECFNYDKSGSNMGEHTNTTPLKPRNKRLLGKNNMTDKHNVENSDSLLNNKNILLVSSSSFDSKKLLFNSNDTDLKLQIGEHRESKKQTIKKQIFSSVLKTSTGNILPMDSFKICYNADRLANENLLDKLASESDSDISFRMDETKSQIIDITDFSSSTDDLARLDKICQIIEISDELSDELFSVLNISETGKKEWSFKELCDKIKLDDFCNKIFGQSI